jgi:adenosylhomocysteine nucleosidase
MSAPVLVCFAVAQEAKPFLQLVRHDDGIHVVITGMGAVNAAREFRREFGKARPEIVFTCGFAGALNPDLKIGDVVCAQDAPVRGAMPVAIACTERIAVTVAEKAALRSRTKADAVEMESGIIREICRELNCPCVTLRAISDTAHEDLPLDFNRLMTADYKLSPGRMALALLKAPQRLPALIRLGRNSALAARTLAEVLHGAITSRRSAAL